MTVEADPDEPATRSVSARELGGVFGVMLAVAVATTYPLITRMGRALPGDLGDPLLNTFISGGTPTGSCTA